MIRLSYPDSIHTHRKAAKTAEKLLFRFVAERATNLKQSVFSRVIYIWCASFILPEACQYLFVGVPAPLNSADYLTGVSDK